MAGSDRRLRRLTGGASGSDVARLLEKISLTVGGATVLGLVVVGWIAARLIGSKTMYMMVYASLVAMVMAYVVGRRRQAIVVDRSDLPLRMRVKQIVAVELRISSPRRISTVVVEEKLPAGLGRSTQIPIGALKAGEELVHRYSFSPTRRGRYLVGPATATWNDPFGFTTHHQTLAEATEVIVHPEVEMARDRVLTRMWEDPPIRPPISKPWPVGFEFYGMRDYVPGDDLRLVVWSAVAKTGKMMVRESEQGITDRVIILIDANREEHSRGAVSETFETAIRAVAAVGVQHLEDGFSVTLATPAGQVLTGLRGARAHLELLDALAVLELDDVPLSAAGPLLIEESRTRPHVLLVTPNVDRDTAKQLKLVVDRGVSVAVAQVLFEESDPTSLGRAFSLGCQVIQVPAGAPLAAVFANAIGSGTRR